MAKRLIKSEILSFRMPKDLVDAIRVAAKEKNESIQTYFLRQIDTNSELARIVEDVRNQYEQKVGQAAVAVMDYVINLAQIKEKSNLSNEEFLGVVTQSIEKFYKEKDEEIKKESSNNLEKK